MAKRALLLLNPKSRQGEGVGEQVRTLLTKAGFELVEPSSGDASSPGDAIRRHCMDVEAIIVGGGDGTLNATADALIEANLPLGILPLGTANDLARTLELPNGLPEACAVIAAGNTRKIDLGWVNGKHFFNVASLGLSVDVTRELSQEVKSRWGILAYLVASARALGKARPFRAEIRSGNERWRVRTVQIAVGNGRYYGGGMTIHDEAKIDDGLLHLYSLEIGHWWRLIPLLPSLRNGTQGRSAVVRTLQGNEFQIRPLSRSRTITADGEITGKTPAHFRLIPLALRVFVPVA